MKAEDLLKLKKIGLITSLLDKRLHVSAGYEKLILTFLQDELAILIERHLQLSEAGKEATTNAEVNLLWMLELSKLLSRGWVYPKRTNSSESIEWWKNTYLAPDLDFRLLGHDKKRFFGSETMPFGGSPVPPSGTSEQREMKATPEPSAELIRSVIKKEFLPGGLFFRSRF